MKNQAPDNGNTQAGNVLFIILIGIALFAALSWALMQGSRSGSSNLTDQQARLAATEVLEYATFVKNTVQQLKINGCTESQISFESAATGAIYVNINNPPDTCKVFSSSGGNLVHIKTPKAILPLNSTWDRPRFASRSAVQDVGTSASELYFWLRGRSKKACMEYNKMVGVNNTLTDAPTDGGFHATPFFTGTYASGTTVSGSGALNGKPTGCHRDPETDTDGAPYYDFYQVLIIR